MALRVGFTGTRYGMTSKQKKSFLELVSKLKPSVFHHGDCKGADEQAHEMVTCDTNIWPPTDDTYRAYCKADTVHDSQDYLVRNRSIVDSTDVMIAVPLSAKEELRSGTWSTIRYARKQKKGVWLILPDGGYDYGS